MKLTTLICAFLMVVNATWAREAFKLAGRNLEKYTIIYTSDSDKDEGLFPALYLQDQLKIKTADSLSIKMSSERMPANTIRLIKSDTISTFNYVIDVKSGKIVVDGGSGWAMNHAIDNLVDIISNKKDIPLSRLTGTVNGKVLFPRSENIDLRIFDDNIWDYSPDSIPGKWRDAGIDCRDSVRAPGFAQLIRAYMPDVICLQEYSRHMDKELYPLLQGYGYKTVTTGDNVNWNNTPIFYDESSFKLLKANYNLFTPKVWSNKGSKSFTSAVFRDKSTGKTFAVVSTHLWWKSDKVKAGSTYARASQVALIMAEVESIKEQFDCPVFVCGDMNSTESSLPMQLFIDGGYVPCYKAATSYGNIDNGHHWCSPTHVGSRENSGKNRTDGAIDHCFIYNGQSSEVVTFECIQPFFSVFLTDHYPNMIDIILK